MQHALGCHSGIATTVISLSRINLRISQELLQYCTRYVIAFQFRAAGCTPFGTGE
jgi:hypothetical protein